VRIGVSIGTTRSLTADRASHLDSSSQLGQHAKLRWRRRSPSAETFSHDQDLERTFGLIGGDIFHGALDLRQIFSARPMLGYADYRGPIAGLYLCGSGGHPGGGVTGAPGHNAAREILRDFKRKRIARAR
jgi:phytoene dehydrogenase-like protein